MYLDYSRRLINAKLAFLGPRASELAEEVYAAFPPPARIEARQLEDGVSFVLEPALLPTFTPRFHLHASGLADFHDPTRELLCRGADGLLINLPEPLEAQREWLEKVRAVAGDALETLPVVLRGTAVDAAALGLPRAQVVSSAMGAATSLMTAVAHALAKTTPDPASAAELSALTVAAPVNAAAVAPAGLLAVPPRLAWALIGGALLFIALALVRTRS